MNNRVGQWAVNVAIACALLVGVVRTSAADTVIYGANAKGLGNIVEINLTDGYAEWEGNLRFETQAIDEDPLTGFVYYFDRGDGANKFGYWDPVSRSNTTVRTYSPSPGIFPKHMAFAPDNTLYMLSNDDRLYTVNKNTGDLVFLGKVNGLEPGNLGRTGDFVFAPDGTLYAATYQSIYRIDINALSATRLYSGLLEEIGGFNVWAGLAYCDGIFYAANIRDQPARSSIFSIDPLTGQVNELFSTNTFVNDLSSCAPSSASQNRPPVLAAIGDKQASEGQTLEVFVDALDPDGDDLSFSVRDLPSGASFTPETRTFSWRPGVLDVGDHVVEFVVSDGGVPGRSDTERITISVSTSALVETATITGPGHAEDASIASLAYAPRSFGGSGLDLAVGATSSGLAARALLKWDVSSIPAGSKIVSAEMRLYSYNDSTDARLAVNVHRLVRPWIEGTLLGQDRRSENPASVCWLESGSGLRWGQDGASGSSDRDPVILETATNVGVGWYSWDITSAVQHWVDGDWVNHGILLESLNEGISNLKYFYASEFQDAGLRPRLVVEYVAGTNSNRPPVLNPIGSRTVDEGQNLTFVVTASDPDDDVLSFSAAGLPPGASFNTATGVFSWTPSAGQAGNHAVQFTVSDDGTPVESDSEQIIITVSAPIGNRPPVLNSIGNRTVDEGETLSFAVSATDPDGDDLSYAAGGLPPGASFNAVTRVFSWTPAAGQAGNYAVQFIVNDDGTPSLSDSDAITILVHAPAPNRPPVLSSIGNRTVAEGEALAFTVTASDPDADDLTFTAAVLPPGATFNTGTGAFSWTPDVGQAGDYTVQFTVQDDGTPVLSDSEQITISVITSPPSDIVAVTFSGEGATSDAMIVNTEYTPLNFGGSPNLYVGAMGGQTARALIRWELSSIPAGATIVSAEMSLYSRVNAAGGQITINAHRMSRAWVEGTQWSSDRRLDNPDSASWGEYGNGLQWEVAGAGGASDRAPEVLASATNAGTGWYSWDLASAVQHWVDGDWVNNGLILVSADESQANAKIFAPSEYQDTNLIPTLRIEYRLP